MPRPHPNFSNLLVFDGNIGEAATPGAFYCPKETETLYGIAKRAYKLPDAAVPVQWRVVNANAYNQQSLVYRAEHAGNPCVSKKTDPAKGFIALCQRDRAEWMKSEGYKMPVLWLPSIERPLPDAGKPEIKIKAREAKIFEPVEPKKLDADIRPGFVIGGDDGDFVINKKGKLVPKGSPEDDVTPIHAGLVPQSSLAKWLMGLGFLGIIGATVVYPAIKKRKKA